VPGPRASLRCAAGHAFDRAREGYWNLLQPQDRRSLRAGDADTAVEARRRFLERGWADALVRDVGEVARIERLPRGAIVADVGCGEGTFARRLFGGGDVAGTETPARSEGLGTEERAAVELCGIDLSATAVRLAARAWPGATWVVANADRFVPFVDRSVHLALSLFGRRPTAELARVLHEDGVLVVAVPAADDLVELREAVLGSGELRDRVPDVVAELAPAFRLEERRTSRVRASLDRQAIEDAMAMTYRGQRASERGRLGEIGELEVTLSAEVLRFVAVGEDRKGIGRWQSLQP
jgi:23S rRNA (guanine745-N1)-methyltransferase